MQFDNLVALAGQIMEGAGVVVIVGGAALAVVLLLRRPGKNPYRLFRQNLGQAILLGLEFLIAADIIRTVSRIPSLMQVGVLAIIVLIRTFLSFTLSLEIYHRWPWQEQQDREETR